MGNHLSLRSLRLCGEYTIFMEQQNRNQNTGTTYLFLFVFRFSTRLLWFQNASKRVFQAFNKTFAAKWAARSFMSAHLFYGIFPYRNT